MTSILHRYPGRNIPVCAGGRGAYLFDSTGKQYLDASGGAAVSILGHGNERVVAAIAEQARALAYAHTAFFTNAPSEALADRLVANAPDGLELVYFVSGGSEANETAIKLARQFHVARGDDARSLIIHRAQSYHGATLGTLAASGNPARRAPYGPMLLPSPEIAPCYAYRHRKPHETPDEYGRRAALELAAAIEAAGPERVAAFIMEPVVGATLGAVPPERGYMPLIREICDRYGVLLIADEIMCGMGRTGTMYACLGEAVAPDILTIAKGLAGGYQPIGAVLLQRRIYEAILDGPGRFEHGHTYVGHPIACAAALAVQDELSEGVLERIPWLGERVRTALEDEFHDHPNVGDIRGRGVLLGLELVADRGSKAPFDPGDGMAVRLRDAAMSEGLIVYPGQGTADGRSGDHILIAPPYIWDDVEIGELVEKLKRALALCLPAYAAA